ncbi:MAG: glycosyltransferase family 2 protein [Anaerolineae bacterium]|nr:glycosyltransferase family 2 protein [Anaerolineae bacterium]
MDKKILILIPAYNEGRFITAVVEGALTGGLPVLVVDDGSKDDTAARAEAAGARVLRQIPNQGKGLALRAGFRQALNEGFDAVITLDADGQHDPAEIALFIESFKRDAADLIIGQRTFKHMPFARRLGNSIGQVCFSWALRQPIHDNQSGYRLIGSRLMQETLNSREEGFEFEVEMIVICARKGFKLAWVPIRTIYGDEKSHIQPIRHVLKFIRLIWHTRRATAG